MKHDLHQHLYVVGALLKVAPRCFQLQRECFRQ
jgi:hypothetical protein